MAALSIIGAGGKPVSMPDYNDMGPRAQDPRRVPFSDATPTPMGGPSIVDEEEDALGEDSPDVLEQKYLRLRAQLRVHGSGDTEEEELAALTRFRSQAPDLQKSTIAYFEHEVHEVKKNETLAGAILKIISKTKMFSESLHADVVVKSELSSLLSPVLNLFPPFVKTALILGSSFFTHRRVEDAIKDINSDMAAFRADQSPKSAGIARYSAAASLVNPNQSSPDIVAIEEPEEEDASGTEED